MAKKTGSSDDNEIRGKKGGPGRPKRADEKTVDFARIDALLVFGEIAKVDGKMVLRWPTVRDLAERGMGSRSAIGRWSQSRKVQVRRTEALRKLSQERLIEMARADGRVYADSLADLPEAVMRKADGTHEPPVIEPVLPTPTGRVPLHALPHEEIERLYVHGEPIIDEKTGSLSVLYPTLEDLKRRFNTSTFAIRRIVDQGDCVARREKAKLEFRERMDQEMVELHVKSQLESRKQVKALVDEYINGFRDALREKRVRFDSPGDLDRMVRLREFLEGSPDQRTSTEHSFTLADLQGARQRAAISGDLDPELTGVVIDIDALPTD